MQKVDTRRREKRRLMVTVAGSCRIGNQERPSPLTPKGREKAKEKEEKRPRKNALMKMRLVINDRKNAMKRKKKRTAPTRVNSFGRT